MPLWKIFPNQKQSVGRMALFIISADPFNVWLDKRQPVLTSASALRLLRCWNEQGESSLWNSTLHCLGQHGEEGKKHLIIIRKIILTLGSS